MVSDPGDVFIDDGRSHVLGTNGIGFYDEVVNKGGDRKVWGSVL